LFDSKQFLNMTTNEVDQFSTSAMDITAVHNLPMPQSPPPLKTREPNVTDAAYAQYALPQTNTMFSTGIVRPSTPTNNNNHITAGMMNMTPSGITYASDFVNQMNTPQGSPSKTHLPPGAFDLPGTFDNSLRLAPPVPVAAPAVSQGSPVSKSNIPRLQQFASSKADLNGSTPSSPTRKGNKENTPPALLTAGVNGSAAQSGIPAPRSPKKELGQVPSLTPAQQSRREVYRTREEKQPAYMQRGLTPEELEKLSKPAVKRLVNVTQLCRFHLPSDAHLTFSRLSRLLL
jgi:hypothetical protein